MKPVKLFEEYTFNEVTCDQCGWHWQLQEGGKDPYVCHHCGHDNSPTIKEDSKWTQS
jgi:hypothetical protein